MVQHVPFIFFLAILAVLYIGNGHYADNNIRNTGKATRELKQLADDAKQFKAVRTEAAYHLTSLAVEAKDAVEAQKYVDQLMQIDVSSAWTQRAMAVRATLPASPAPAAATPAGEGKKEESAGVQVKLPGK